MSRRRPMSWAAYKTALKKCYECVTRRWSVHINPGLWLTDKTGPSSRF